MIREVRKAWEGMYRWFLSSIGEGGVVAAVPILNHTRHAVDHNAASSLESPVEILVNFPESFTVWSPAIRGTGSSLGREPLVGSPWGVSGVETPLGCRISWKLFRAASDTSPFLQRAASSMYSSSRTHALGKSPTTYKYCNVFYRTWKA